MTEFEIATLAQNQWIVLLAGGALLVNSIATLLTTIGLRSAIGQLDIQRRALRQQVLATEISFITHELSLLDVRGGVDNQVRISQLQQNLKAANDALRALVD